MRLSFVRPSQKSSPTPLSSSSEYTGFVFIHIFSLLLLVINAKCLTDGIYDGLCCLRIIFRDPKVRKSVERIFTIWEERSVYPEEVIGQFKAGLNKREKEREKLKEKEKEKVKEKAKEKEKEKEKEVPPENGQSDISSLNE